MLIYIPNSSPRIQYIFDFVLKETLNIEYEVTSHLDFFKSADNRYKWVYGLEISDAPCLPAASLLWEKNVEPQKCSKLIYEDIIPIFQTENYGEIYFDIFASIFYLISRYEEFLPCVKDNHGRYAACQSIAFNYGFLETAMVNRYIVWLMRWLKAHFKELDIKMSKPKSLVTLDIDHPFYAKDVPLDKWLRRSIKEFSFFKDNDKYDTYDFILDTLDELPSIFFILCPEHPTDMDHLNQRNSTSFLQLLKELKSKTKIGIHPSYYAEERKWLSSETEWLSRQHEASIKSSRFHYLRIDMETSPGSLLKCGIQNDFSLGYGTHAGWRTSTSIPYFLFDLTTNKKTNLKIYSPCLMDSVFKYNKWDNFREKMDIYIAEVANYGGVFIPIFHNDVIADEEWKSHFSYCVAKMKLLK